MERLKSKIIYNNKESNVSVRNVSIKKSLYFFFKRSFDVLLSLVTLILLFIPMVVIGVCICIDSPGSPIFKQYRIGKNRKAFVMYKFRSMYIDAPSEKSTASFIDSEKYITKVGLFIRKTSLDELPQLINILRGDMSFVGFRPVCTTEETITRLRDDNNVFIVKPGLTGLAQINGRDNLSDKQKVALDKEYVENMSLILDFRCILKTVSVVLKQNGVR